MCHAKWVIGTYDHEVAALVCIFGLIFAVSTSYLLYRHREAFQKLKAQVALDCSLRIHLNPKVARAA